MVENEGVVRNSQADSRPDGENLAANYYFPAYIERKKAFKRNIEKRGPNQFPNSIMLKTETPLKINDIISALETVETFNVDHIITLMPCKSNKLWIIDFVNENFQEYADLLHGKTLGSEQKSIKCSNPNTSNSDEDITLSAYIRVHWYLPSLTNNSLQNYQTTTSKLFQNVKIVLVPAIRHQDAVNPK